MISLQIALLIAGVVVFLIVLIVSYDKINRAKKHRLADPNKNQEEPSLANPNIENMDNDVLMQSIEKPSVAHLSPGMEPRLKPEFLDEEKGAEEADAELDEQYSEIDEAEQISNTPVRSIPNLEKDPDDGLQIEFVVRIPGKNVIKRDSALGIYRQHEFELNKFHRIYGLSYPAGMWCDLERQAETARFTDIGMTIQLADRDGPICETQLNQFSQIALKMAEVFGRRLQFSEELDHALEQAQRLDELIKKYDSVAVLNVAARNSVFYLSDVDETARTMGLLLRKNNVYVKYENDQICYRLACMEQQADKKMSSPVGNSTQGVTLFMDIPKTKDPANVFSLMVNDAKEICKHLDGKLVDQNQRGMTQKGLKRINQQIRQMTMDMDKDGIKPGSEYTLKLF